MSEIKLDKVFWRDKIILEYLDLKEKLDALDRFYDSSMFKSLPVVDVALLDCQKRIMNDYLLCLETRLKRFDLWEKTINCLDAQKPL